MSVADDSYAPSETSTQAAVLTERKTWMNQVWKPILALSMLFSGAAIFLLVFTVTASSGNQSSEQIINGSPHYDINPAQSTKPTFAPTDIPSLPPTLKPSLAPLVSLPLQLNTTYNRTLPPGNLMQNSTYPPIEDSTPAPAPTDTPFKSPVYPTLQPTLFPTTTIAETTFYAIGDVPYTPKQANELYVRMGVIPADAEFVIHVGDLQPEKLNETCPPNGYKVASNILRRSHAPVFVILGDNEWNDCLNKEEALGYWREEFEGFDSRYWNHTFDLQRQPGRSENFAFVHKRTLFVALNIVGGTVHNNTEWENRLTDQFEWTRLLILRYRASREGVGRIVIFGHANPQKSHRPFFDPLRDFIEKELRNSIPMLYLNGDKHVWSYDSEFLGQPSLLRIMLTGGSEEPPVKIVVHANGEYEGPRNAFRYDRRI